MKRFIIPDIHGELELLELLIEDVLEYTKAFGEVHLELIFLGDYVDRGPDSCGVIEFLIKLSKSVKCIFLMGNHDQEFLEYIKSGNTEHHLHPFYTQGFKETINSYINKGIELTSHLEFLENLLPYYIFEQEDKKHIAVHGGFDPLEYVEDQASSTFYWDRYLIQLARDRYIKGENLFIPTKNNFEMIYVGHTPVQCYEESTPQSWCNLWAMDTGVGKLKNVNLWALDVDRQELI